MDYRCIHGQYHHIGLITHAFQRICVAPNKPFNYLAPVIVEMSLVFRLLHFPAIIICCTISSAALAQTTAVHGGSPSQITIAMPVTAFVSGRCAFSAPP